MIRNLTTAAAALAVLAACAACSGSGTSKGSSAATQEAAVQVDVAGAQSEAPVSTVQVPADAGTLLVSDIGPTVSVKMAMSQSTSTSQDGSYSSSE